MVLVVIEAVVLAFLALLVAGLLRSHAEILRTFHDLGVGRDPGAAAGGRHHAGAGADARARAGGFRVDRDGHRGRRRRRATRRHRRRRTRRSPRCSRSSRAAASPATTSGRRSPTRASSSRAGPASSIVTMGAEAESESAIAKLAPPDVTVLMSSEAWDDYEVPGSPYFVFVEGESGRVVGQGTAPDWDQVVRLMTAGRRRRRARGVARRGRTPARAGPSAASSTTVPARRAPTRS